MILIPAAIAWACNPQAHLNLNKASYGPGESMVISGSYFNNDDTIRVSGAGISTTVRPSGGGFKITATAPSNAGDYTITASREGGYRNGLPKSTSFAVRAAGSPTAGSQQTGSATEQGGGQAFGEPGVTRSPQKDVARSPRGGGGGQEQSSEQTGGVAGGGTVVSDGSGQQVFAGSAAPAPAAGSVPGTATADAASQAARKPAGGAAARPSERAATSDVWSGFAPGETASLTSGAGEPDGGTGSQLGPGIGLLALGLLALVAGLTAAEVRRRRALAGH